MKKKILIAIIAVIILCLIGLGVYLYLNREIIIKEEASTLTILKDNKKDTEYDKCMKKPYQMYNLDEEFNKLLNKYKHKGLAIAFTDVNNNYTYYLNPDKTYYSGCVTKLFGTIFLIEKARAGEIDLHEKIEYLPIDKKPASDLMDKHEFNEEIEITTLLEYYMTTSDNTAYYMLVRRFGTEAINNYIRETYNIELHFTDNHPFEAQYTARMANESLKILYKDLQVDDEYTEIIRRAMNNDEYNGLNFDDVRFLHKYGEFDKFHNDIGIYDTENPYIVSFLTLYAYDDFMTLISDMNKDFYNLYEKNLKSKESFCEIYTKK